jgi:hypothetical protein
VSASGGMKHNWGFWYCAEHLESEILHNKMELKTSFLPYLVLRIQIGHLFFTGSWMFFPSDKMFQIKRNSKRYWYWDYSPKDSARWYYTILNNENSHSCRTFNLSIILPLQMDRQQRVAKHGNIFSYEKWTKTKSNNQIRRTESMQENNI